MHFSWKITFARITPHTRGQVRETQKSSMIKGIQTKLGRMKESKMFKNTTK